VAAGQFREDLFYRLSVIPIAIPPLRERREDIPALVEHFLRKHGRRTGRHAERLSEDAMKALLDYDWPGNVRELENAIERAVVLSAGPLIEAREVTLHGAGAPPTAGLPSLKLHSNVDWAERESVRLALQQAQGVKKDAAALLGISQRALSYYLAKYGLG
jgi:DNA-binding NtrC family response regulator